MATVLYIGDAGASDQFSITENGRFNLETRCHLNDLGFPDTLETLIEIEGDVVQGGSIAGQAIAGTPDGVYGAIELIQSQAKDLSKLKPRHFYVQVDGVTRFDFPPASCINSPIITNFRTIQDTGAGDAHWKYGMSVYVRQLARPDGVLEFTSSIATTSIITSTGPRPIRKHWAASCKAGNVNTAYARIIALAPSAPMLAQTYTRFFQEGRATGEWTWDYNQNQKIEEQIQVTGLGPSYAASSQVGASGEDVMPLIHKTPRQPIVVILNGTISSVDPSLVTQPELHWVEGGGALSDKGGLYHDLGNEQVGERVIFDAMRGVYQLKYQERWIGTSYNLPNHHGHDTIPVLPEPGDGPIAGIST